MSSNLTLEDIDHIKALVDEIDSRIQGHLKKPSSDTICGLGTAVALTREFLNGYAAALRHFEKKEGATK